MNRIYRNLAKNSFYLGPVVSSPSDVCSNLTLPLLSGKDTGRKRGNLWNQNYLFCKY